MRRAFWLLRQQLLRARVLCGHGHLEGLESILVIAPHPDDEVLGCGGLIARVLAAGIASGPACEMCPPKRSNPPLANCFDFVESVVCMDNSRVIICMPCLLLGARTTRIDGGAQ